MSRELTSAQVGLNVVDRDGTRTEDRANSRCAPEHRGHRVELLHCHGGVCVHPFLRGFTREHGRPVPANPRSMELPGFEGREPGQRSLSPPGGRFVIGIPHLNQGGATCMVEQLYCDAINESAWL